MTSSTRSVLARAGAAALLAAGGLAVMATPASATDTTDLVLSPMSSVLTDGTTKAKAKPFKFHIFNAGEASASDVRVTIDVSRLDTELVRHDLPESCAKQKKVYTCALDDLSPGGAGGVIRPGTSEEFGIPLFTRGGTGNGGKLVVTVDSAVPDADEENNSLTTERIRVVKASYDLTAWSQDVWADVVVDGDDADEANLTPVAPNGTADLDWLVYNAGSRRAVGLFYVLALPDGARFAEVPEGCVKEDEAFEVYHCTDADVVLRPGQIYHRPVKVQVEAGAEFEVLTPGVVTAFGLNDVSDDASVARSAPQPGVGSASEAQRNRLKEKDPQDNISLFDIFVVTKPGPSPSGPSEPSPGPTPTDGGGSGGGGGLPVTGAQAGLIGGVGLGVVAVGGVLFLLARRRRVVLVTPGDEKPAS